MKDYRQKGDLFRFTDMLIKQGVYGLNAPPSSWVASIPFAYGGVNHGISPPDYPAFKIFLLTSRVLSSSARQFQIESHRGD